MAAEVNTTRQRVLLVARDNFTPRTRTPWGGTRLATLKGITTDTPLVIGESWEVSVEPSFPTALADGSALLSEVIAADPHHWLGRDAELGNMSLLVKLLDTDDVLSVQIHPRDDYRALSVDESGKPESWYVVAAEPGAGIYLGLSAHATSATMSDCLAAGGNLAELLTFVEVAEGDFFVIEAGTPHAIGPGLTLVEPQRVLPGRRGKTYRYWDWNRLYDDQGQPSETGKARELDVEAALAVTRFDARRGDSLLQQVRRRVGRANCEQRAHFTALSDREADGAVRFSPLSVGRVTGDGPLELEPADFLRSITVIGGALSIEGNTVTTGGSIVLAGDGQPYELQCSNTHAIVAAAHLS